MSRSLWQYLANCRGWQQKTGVPTVAKADAVAHEAEAADISVLDQGAADEGAVDEGAADEGAADGAGVPPQNASPENVSPENVSPRKALAGPGPERKGASDGGNVPGALRLGWQLAEVRGRCRVVVPPEDVEPSLASRQLPLTAAAERTPASATIEATLVLVSVAQRMNVDFEMGRLTNLTPVDDVMRQAKARLTPPGNAGAGPAHSEGTEPRGSDAPSGRPWTATELLRYLVCLVLFERPDGPFPVAPAAAGEPVPAVAGAAVPAAAGVGQAGAGETAKAAVRIAAALGVDLAVAMWATAEVAKTQPAGTVVPAGTGGLAPALADLGTDEPLRSSPPEPPAWKLLQTMLFRWDEAIQDMLAQGTFGDSSAYQLARGLAESYWALEISGDLPPAGSPPLAGSWQFLLGRQRAATFATLCDRLSGPIDPNTATAIKFCVGVWEDWVCAAFGKRPQPRPLRKAQDKARRKAEKEARKGAPAEAPAVVFSWVDMQASASVDLYNQVTVWRDLLLTQRDPKSYVGPDSLLSVLASPRLLLKSFRAELVTAFAGAGSLALAIPDFKGLWAKLVTALGAVGLTSSALGASAKKNAQAVDTQVKAALDQQAIDEAVLRPGPANRRRIGAAASAARRELLSTLRSWLTTREQPARPGSPFARTDNLGSPMARVLPGSRPQPKKTP